jgi:tripartite-type tricarboxylate transporter receptor subunit TctC
MGALPGNAKTRTVAVALALALTAAACSSEAAAPTPQPAPSAPTAPAAPGAPTTGNFEGETITFLIGRSPGGGFDLYARVIGPFIAEALGASAVFENMGGAGGALAESEIAFVRPADCLTVGIMGPRGTIPAQMIGATEAIRYDVRTDFNFIGRLASEPQIWAAGAHTGYTSIQDVLDVGKFSSGASGLSAVGAINSVAVRNAFNLDWDLVVGFGSGAEARVEVQRGGLDGIIIDAPPLLEDIAAGILNPLLVLGFETPEGYEDLNVPVVPDILNLVDAEGAALLNTVARLAELARAFFVRSGCAPERLAEMRAAYETVMASQAFKNAVELAGTPVAPMSGEVFEQLVLDTFDEMPEVFLDAIRDSQ